MNLKCPSCGALIGRDGLAETEEISCGECAKTFHVADLSTVIAPPAPRDGPQSPPEDERLSPGTLLGQYKILDFLGKGGMGSVYKALHTLLDRIVALKVLPNELAEDAEFVHRFNREARTLANLSHPNIVSIHDMDVQGTTYYFIMEYVDGVTLRQLLNLKSLTPENAFKLIPQLCDALEYAHGEGIVHRDIKPENIMIDVRGRIKVTDFGLAKIVKGEVTTGLTQTNILMGTPDYMAPEQRQSTRNVDHRADIYSLGVVLYEMLTGELPIGHFPPPSKVAAVNGEIDTIVLKALEREPENRYQRVSEVKQELKPFLPPDSRPIAFSTPAAGVIPWENRRHNLFLRWWKTCGMVNFRPYDFFNAMPSTGGHWSPILFTLMTYLQIGTLVTLLCWGPYNVLTLSHKLGFRESVLETLVWYAFGYGGSLLSLYFMSSIFFLITRAMGARTSFPGLLRIVGFANATAVWQLLIPFLGILVQIVWTITFYAKGFQRVLGLSRHQAILAALLPSLFLCGFTLGGMVFFSLIVMALTK